MTSSRPDNVISPIFAGTGRHKPDDVRKTQGTFRADRSRPDANFKKIEPDFEPVAPEWMIDPVAVEYFEQAYRILRDAGVLTFADLGILEIYAMERAMIQRRYEQALVEEVDGQGRSSFRVIPGMLPGTEKLSAFRTLSTELGFTPVSRHKVGPGRTGGGNKDGWGDL